MSEVIPVIRYTGLSAYVEAYAKGAYAYPVLSFFGAKTSVQAIAAALVSRKADVLLSNGEETQEVYLTVGEYRVYGKTLPCGAHHALVIHTSALIRHCALPYFFLFGRSGEERLRSCYFSFLDRLLPVPLLQDWAGWLWERGIEKGEIEALEGYRLMAYECRVDMEGLKEDLSKAIRKKQLRLSACSAQADLEVSQHEISRQGQGGVLPHAAIRR
jgi:hypothetical protein